MDPTEWKVAGVLRSRTLVEMLKVPLRGRKKILDQLVSLVPQQCFLKNRLWTSPYW